MSYASVVSALTPDAWWRFEEASGTFADETGHGNTATASGTIAYRNGGIANSWAVGFPVTGGSLSVTDSSTVRLGTTAFSVVAWIKANVAFTPSFPAIMRKGAAGTTGWQLYLLKGNPNVGFKREGFDHGSTFGQPSNWNALNMIAVTWANADQVLRFYVNGSASGTVASRTYSNTEATSNLTIGTGENECYPSTIDEVSLWGSTQISATDISNIWAERTFWDTGAGDIAAKARILQGGRW